MSCLKRDLMARRFNLNRILEFVCFNSKGMAIFEYTPLTFIMKKHETLFSETGKKAQKFAFLSFKSKEQNYKRDFLNTFHSKWFNM